MADQPKKDVIIKIRGLVNAFGDKIIHDHIDLDVYRGEVLEWWAARAPASPSCCAPSSA